MNLFKDRCDMTWCVDKATEFIRLNRKGKFQIIQNCSHHQSIAMEIMGDDYEASKTFDVNDKDRCKHIWNIEAELSKGAIEDEKYLNDTVFGAVERCVKCKMVREKIYSNDLPREKGLL